MLDDESKTFLLDYLDTPSPTEFEWRGQKKWVDYTRRYADTVENDAYGTAWATLKGSAKTPKTIMLEAHADEIGFMVKMISKDGFMHLDILGDKGLVRGVVGNTAIHIRDRENEKAPLVHELYVDIGASNAKEVAS